MDATAPQCQGDHLGKNEDGDQREQGTQGRSRSVGSLIWSTHEIR